MSLQTYTQHCPSLRGLLICNVSFGCWIFHSHFLTEKNATQSAVFYVSERPTLQGLNTVKECSSSVSKNLFWDKERLTELQEILEKVQNRTQKIVLVYQCINKTILLGTIPLDIWNTPKQHKCYSSARDHPSPSVKIRAMQAAATSASHPASHFFFSQLSFGPPHCLGRLHPGCTFLNWVLCSSASERPSLPHLGAARWLGEEAKLNLQLGNSSELNVKELGKDWWLCPWHIVGKWCDFLIQIQHMLIFMAVHFFSICLLLSMYQH